MNFKNSKNKVGKKAVNEMDLKQFLFLPFTEKWKKRIFLNTFVCGLYVYLKRRAF